VKYFIDSRALCLGYEEGLVIPVKSALNLALLPGSYPDLQQRAMLPLWHYLVAYALFHLQCAAALPQGTPRSEVSNVIPALSTRQTSTGEDDRNCDFDTMQDFFDYATENGLNITLEVQNCQNLCLLTYGVGNPDLSGIGVSVTPTNPLRRLEAVADQLAPPFGCR
jgi:hypothetical protein